MILALLLPLTADAASISLDYSLGFNEHFHLGSWTPLTVVLENRGRTTQGVLEVVVTSGSEFLRTVHQTVHAMDVELPYNSTKLISFTIHLSSFTHDILLQLRHNDEVLVSTTINLRSMYTEKPMVVVLDERITPDFLSVLPPDKFAVNAQPRFLPEAVFGYEGVDMLIVNAGVLKSLREKQFQALQEWLKQGGFLVTSGSMNYGVFHERRWQSLMPMQVLGHHEFSEIASFKEFCGQPLGSEHPFLVLQALLQGGQVVLEEQNVHLLTEKQIGAGKILFLAFDLQHPPFSHWDGREKFWEHIQTLRPESMHVTVDTDKQTLLEALLKSMPAGFPDKRLAFALVGLYLLLFKLITVSFGRRGVKNWRVISLTFVLILLFSGGSYGIFFYPNQRQRLAYDSILHVHASGDRSIAVGEFILGVYGLKNTAYTFGFGESAYPIKPLVAHASSKQTPAPYILQYTDTAQHVQGTLDKWSYNFFTFSTSLDFQMSARAKHNAQEGVSLAFENPTPHKLNTTYGYFAGRLFPLGTIAADATTTISLSMSKIQEQELFDTAQLRTLFATISDTTRLPFWQQIQQELTKYLLANIQQTYNEREDILVLVGWIASPLIETQFTYSGVIGASATLVTWVIPVE